jgi:hypothetical protein
MFQESLFVGIQLGDEQLHSHIHHHMSSNKLFLMNRFQANISVNTAIH